MDIQRMAAILLLIAGALGLMYGGFSYTKETHNADLGRSERHGSGWAVVGGALEELTTPRVPRQACRNTKSTSAARSCSSMRCNANLRLPLLKPLCML